MSWIEVPTRKFSGAAKYHPPVSLSCAGGKRFNLMVRGVPAVQAWLRPGTLVAVLRGEGADAGLLRIAPNGLHLVKTSGGKRSKVAASLLVLPLLPGAATAANKQEAVEFRAGDKYLEVVLPVWAGGKPKPFSSVANSVPLIDPARVAARGRAIG